MRFFWWSKVAAGELVRPKFYYTDQNDGVVHQNYDVAGTIDGLLQQQYIEISALTASELGLPV